MTSALYNATNITTSTQLTPQATNGEMLGIFVSAATSTPTIKVWDSLSASGAVLVGTFTPVAATWYTLPFNYRTGLYVELGGTVDCTVAWI